MSATPNLGIPHILQSPAQKEVTANAAFDRLDEAFWSAGNPTRLTVPAGVSKVSLEGNIDWTFGGSGYRHLWIHKNGGLFFGTAKESDEGDAGVQSIGSAVVDVTPGDYFQLIARQTSGSTENVAADELTWFAIEVVE
jgi:hypothetical protein